jgi:hypothetical protein
VRLHVSIVSPFTADPLRVADSPRLPDHSDLPHAHALPRARSLLRSVSPRECRRARYSAYEQSTSYAGRSFDEVVED